jgi:hypothetical protein
MSKLNIQTQILIAFVVVNLVLLVVGQPLLLINELIDEQVKITLLRVISTVGILSLATIYLSNNSNNSKSA